MKRSKFSEEQVVYAFRIAIAGSRSCRSRPHHTAPFALPRSDESRSVTGQDYPLISIFYEVKLLFSTIIRNPVRRMKATLLTGMVSLVLAGVTPAFGEEPLLYETWVHSYFNPGRLDEFIQAHRAQYLDDYFQCSQEAQRLLREESNVRDRRCDFSPGSGVRSSCRKENQFRGLDKHLAELDQAIRTHKAWLDVESGRNAATAARAAEAFESSCTQPACDIAKRKKNEVLRDLRPYLQCPPITERPADVDPSFKTFEFPTDQGG